MKVNFFFSVERDGQEIELEIDASCTPGDPGCHTLRNGDPGYPPEPPEAEILKVTRLDSNEEFILTDPEWMAATEKAIEKAAEEYADNYPE